MTKIQCSCGHTGIDKGRAFDGRMSREPREIGQLTIPQIQNESCMSYPDSAGWRRALPLKLFGRT